jgi:hypothetical protein
MALIMPHSVFLHVPKTGGSWCREAIARAGIPCEESPIDADDPIDSKHHELAHVCRYLEGRMVIAFVRDPLDWWRSYWAYRQHSGWYVHPIDVQCKSTDFQEFMTNVVRTIPEWCSAMYERFVGPPECPIEFIGRYENLAEDLVLGLQLAGESFDEEALRATPPVNVNDYSCWPAEYTPELRQAVTEAEHAAIARFGYAALHDRRVG